MVTQTRNQAATTNPPVGGSGGGAGGGSGGGAGGGSGPQGGAPVPEAAGQPPYSLTPAQLIQGIIDYNTKTGKSHWKAATQKLEDKLYDANPDGFYQFNKSTVVRAQEFDWTSAQGVRGK